MRRTVDGKRCMAILKGGSQCENTAKMAGEAWLDARYRLCFLPSPSP